MDMATEKPLVDNVAVLAGKVTVFVPAVAGATTVIAPEDDPFNTRLVVQVSVGCVMPVVPLIVTVIFMLQAVAQPAAKIAFLHPNSNIYHLWGMERALPNRALWYLISMMGMVLVE